MDKSISDFLSSNAGHVNHDCCGLNAYPPTCIQLAAEALIRASSEGDVALVTQLLACVVNNDQQDQVGFARLEG